MPPREKGSIAPPSHHACAEKSDRNVRFIVAVNGGSLGGECVEICGRLWVSSGFSSGGKVLARGGFIRRGIGGVKWRLWGGGGGGWGGGVLLEVGLGG